MSSLDHSRQTLCGFAALQTRSSTRRDLPGGPRAGSRAELQDHLQTYYQLRGWDERGVPTREKLDELGLEDTWGVVA